MTKVVDCFTYYHDYCREMLELRLKILSPHVDKFIITEMNYSHSGKPSEFRLKKTLEELGVPEDKVLVIETCLPDSIDHLVTNQDTVNAGQNAHNKNSVLARVRERIQRDAMTYPVKDYDDDTMFIISDCDEIVNPFHLDYLKKMAIQFTDSIIKVPLVYLEGRADLRVHYREGNPYPWMNSLFVCTKKHLEKTKPNNIRSNVENPFPIVWLTIDGKILEDMGWHFSWMGNQTQKKSKRESFIHYQDKYDHLDIPSYDSNESKKHIDDGELKEWDLPPSGESGTVLRKYDVARLPQAILENEMLRNFFLPNTKYRLFEWGELETFDWFRNRIDREVFKDRIYEKYHKVPSNAIVVDIGASVGPFVYSIGDRNPKKIYAIEPSEHMLPTLRKNVGHLDNVVIIECAIAPVNGHTEITGIFDKEDSGRDIWRTDDTEKRPTYGLTWGSFIEENKITHIDFLKTDCEGGEYDIFTKENLDWIAKNVDYIVGEWHLETSDLKLKFYEFRETYLKNFKNIRIESASGENILPYLWNYEFIDYFGNFTVYIDNRKMPEVATISVTDITKNRKKKDYWKRTQIPTMEITTNIAKGGCVIDCEMCPQRVLVNAYKGDRVMTLENFVMAMQKIPREVRITFAGFTEPFLNKHCTDMVVTAHELGHPVSVFTTGVGMRPEDVERLANIPYAGDPNGGFVLHLPDQKRYAKHPLNANYIRVVEKFKELEKRIRNFRTMAMGPVHESVSHLFPVSEIPTFWNRAGNVNKEKLLREISPVVRGMVNVSAPTDQPRTCGCVEDLYHNVLLPNGEVSLCCMDYDLEHIIGNLWTQDYDDLVPKPQSCFKLCQSCENGVKPRNLLLGMNDV